LLGDAAISNKSTIKIREFLATLSPVYIQSSPLFKRFQNGLSVLENYYKSISIHSREEDKKFPPLFMINSTIVDFTEQLIQSNFSNTTLDLILDLPVKEHYLKIDQLISKCLANGNLQAAFTILQNEKISEDIYKNMSSPYLLLELAKKLGSLDFVEEKVKAMIKKYPDIALYLYCWENIKNKNYTIAYELQQKISNVFLAEKIASEIQNSLQKEHPDIQITRSNSNAWLKQLLLGINASVSSYVFKINCTERKWDDAIAGLPKLSNQKEGLAFLIKSTLSAGEMELAIQYFADHCIPAEYLAPISSIIEALCLVDQHSKAVETIDNLLHPKFQSTSYLDLAHSYITIHQYSKAAETLLKARLKSKHADYPQFINTRVFSLFDKIFGSLSNEKRFKELCIIFSSTKDLLNHYATNIATLLKDNPESEELKQVLGKIANKQVKRKLDQMNNPHKKRKH
jgi:hypothetical protein